LYPVTNAVNIEYSEYYESGCWSLPINVFFNGQLTFLHSVWYLVTDSSLFKENITAIVLAFGGKLPGTAYSVR